MSIWKKAVSVGLSATLLASLAITVVAPAALGAVTVVSAGAVPIGATSTGTVTFTFTEQTATSFANGPGSFDVVINDINGGNVFFSGTPAIDPLGTPGSLGASASIIGTGNTLHIAIAASDLLNIESIKVIGLKIRADSGATVGAISAQMINFAGSIASAAAVQAGGTATGTLAVGHGIGDTSFLVNVTSGACLFTITGTLGSGALSFATSPETKNITAAGPLVVGQQTLTIVAAANVHNAGEVVSQTNSCAPNGIIDSPGTVVNALALASAGNPPVYAGESNGPAADLFLTEPVAGFLTTTTVVTLTINTVGVTFSTRPLVVCLDGDTVTALTQACTWGSSMQTTLSVDRKTATFTMPVASTAPSALAIDNIFYDVATTVPGGTFVEVGVGLSGGLIVSPATETNAVVNRGINATATPTTVYIGENAQATGLTTITELQAGFFTDGLGAANFFEVCLPQEPYFTSPGPWAKVSTGNLRLREGAVASPDNIVQGTAEFNSTYGDWCYYWTVWTASTTASTILIGNADFTSGPLIDVPANSTPGSQAMDIYIGSSLLSNTLSATVQIATKVFRNQVAVTALSQPTIPAGATDALAGNIQVAETGIGQLKNGEWICVEVLPRTSNNFIQDTFLKALNTADVPVATASGGVVISSVSFLPIGQGCNMLTQPGLVTPSGTHVVAFQFQVMQQSLTGQGKVVVSNIHYITTADAPNGNVLVNVFGIGGSPTFVQFQSTISNARIGSAQVDAWIAAGNNVRAASAFGLNTVVVPQSSRVTLRFKAAGAPAGTLVQIWVKTKTTAWALETNRRITSDSYAYYSPKVLNKGYRYYRVVVFGNLSNTVRAYGK